ncbi:hypothetical protein ABB37_07882 [Leptomonas pyrrhocoris]|uniref:CFA20 domain-containing protein n=1 Tax=Leptomonas pyrrhocoris TaxID=157538 RepID=A0A0M9FU29_LEPPY|nr:hypothetical protein ABB37_07882 [Leptomonas pyrrhocoris]KPA76110.1 hypothetical protein ABB37_07882 [Leptomonas pyrrhocoris]|eukprot:XP_015654549.1 hypothetical protein ABB37_07882 [Leptomonas pyrrhocoris]
MNPYFYSHHHIPPSRSPRINATAAKRTAAHRDASSPPPPPPSSRASHSTSAAEPAQGTAQHGGPPQHLRSPPDPGSSTTAVTTPPSPALPVGVPQTTRAQEGKAGVLAPPPLPAPQPVSSAVPCLVLFSPQGPRPLSGLTTTSSTTTTTTPRATLSHGGSTGGSTGHRALLQNRSSSVNRLVGGDSPAKGTAGLSRGSAPPLNGVRCVYDRDTRSQLLHIAPGTEVDFSGCMRLPVVTRGSAGAGGGVVGHTILVVQFCAAAPVLSAAERQRTLPSTLSPPYLPPPGSVHIELVVRTTTNGSGSGNSGRHHDSRSTALMSPRSNSNAGSTSSNARGGYRLRFTNAVREVQRHAHHTRIPLQCVRTAQWVQLYVDVDSVVQACGLQGGLTASKAAATAAFRLHQLRIGAGATASGVGGGGGSGGLYVRRIVAGHGLPLPRHHGVDHLLHPAGQQSFAEASMTVGGGGPVAGAAPATWTLPEPLRLPAEAGEVLTLFVRTGEEVVLRTPPPPPPPLGTTAEEIGQENLAKAAQHAEQPELHPLSGQPHIRRDSTKSHPPSAAVPPFSGAPQRSSTPPSAQLDAPKVAEGRGTSRHREPQPSLDHTSPRVQRKEKPRRPHPTALELLQVNQNQHQQHQQQQQQQQYPSEHQVQTRPRSSHLYANTPTNRFTEVDALSGRSSSSSPSPSEAEAFAGGGVVVSTPRSTLPGGVSPSPRFTPQARQSPREQRHLYKGNRGATGEGERAQQYEREEEEEKDEEWVVEGTPARGLDAAAVVPSSSSQTSAAFHHPSVKVSTPPADRKAAAAAKWTAFPSTPSPARATTQRPSSSFDNVAGASGATSMETSSVASAPTTASTSSSALSCTSAAVELMREMNERVRRLHTVLTKHQGAAPDLDVPARLLSRNALTKATAAPSSSSSLLALPPPLPAAPAAPLLPPPAADPTTDGEGVAEHAAAAEPRAGVRRAATAMPALSTKAHGTTTPLSLLAAIMGDAWKGNDAAAAAAAAAGDAGSATALHAGARSDGDDGTHAPPLPPATASVSTAAAGDAKAVLELWSSGEVPLALPLFSAPPSRPTSRRAAHDAAIGREGGRAEEEEDDNAPLPPRPGSAVTSWTFRSTSIAPAATTTTTTTATATASENAAAGPPHIISSAAAAAGALPREEALHRAHVLARTPPMSSNTVVAGLAPARAATKAVVWRRPAATVEPPETPPRPPQPAAGKRATRDVASDEVRLGESTPLGPRLVRPTGPPDTTASAGGHGGKDAKAAAPVKRWAVQREAPSPAQPPPVPLAPTASDLPTEESARQTPLRGAVLKAPRSAPTNKAQNAAMTPTLHPTDAAPPSHQSCSTVSSFHMWLPHPMPVLSASRARYPVFTTPSSGGVEGTRNSEGRSHVSWPSTALRNNGDDDGAAAAAAAAEMDAASRRAAPPAVRLSAAGVAPFAQMGLSARSGGKQSTNARAAAPSATAAAASSAVPLGVPLQPDDGGRRDMRAPSPRDAPGAVRTGDAQGGTNHYIYDSVLQCYLDLATNAYVESVQ